MQKIHLQDVEALSRIFGDTIPAHVANECETRARMYHRAGGCGPLGPLAIMEMLRYMGLDSGSQRDPVAHRVDWTTVPANTPIEALLNNEWQPALFMGGIGGGALAVRFGHSPMVQERRPFEMRLPQATRELTAAEQRKVQDRPPVEKPFVENPLNRPPPLPDLDEPIIVPFKSASDSASDTVSHGEVASQASQDEVSIAVEVEEPEDDWHPREDEPIDWKDVRGKCRVWISDDGDVLDGVFSGPDGLRRGPDGFDVMTVVVNGKQREFPASKAVYAGPVIDLPEMMVTAK